MKYQLFDDHHFHEALTNLHLGTRTTLELSRRGFLVSTGAKQKSHFTFSFFLICTSINICRKGNYIKQETLAYVIRQRKEFHTPWTSVVRNLEQRTLALE
ncbi:unnamed protein product [Phytomonas sp. EM1]|nr:unnamed protein product [Phytomonas sp. EM1]|eukprot:CCW62539.1 unnamed protein product [Phytomonas sp. isolate EM1]